MRYWLFPLITSLFFLSSCGSQKNSETKSKTEPKVNQTQVEGEMQESWEVSIDEEEKECYPFTRKENFNDSDEDKPIKILEAYAEGKCIRFVYQYSGCSTKMATMLIDTINIMDSKKQAIVYLKPLVRGAGDCEMLIEDETSFKINPSIRRDFEISWILADSHKPIPIIK